MPHYFTLEQAEKLLPRVEEQIRQAIHLKQEHQQAQEQIQRIAQQVAFAGGMLVNREELLSWRARRDATAMRLKETIEAIHECGCQIKDLDIGLLDFPTVFRGEEVLLCWRLGEPGIRFWHGLHEGYRGRKQIDREFMENHRGDSMQ